jgi:hypothetical protein
MADNSKLEALLEQSIQAQNRTTHAVRALATYFLTQIAWGIPGGILVGLGFVNSNFTPIVFGMFLLIVGFLHAFARGTSELKKSALISNVLRSHYAEDGTALPATASKGEWLASNWLEAERELAPSEMRAWEKAGQPALAKWVAAGRPPFKDWLQNGPF